LQPASRRPAALPPVKFLPVKSKSFQGENFFTGKADERGIVVAMVSEDNDVCGGICP